MDSTSATLLDQVRSPSAHAARLRFVRLYAPLLAHWARLQGLQQADADDLVQDVFAAVFAALPTFHYDSNHSFRAWLKTVALNALRDRRRKKAPLILPDHAPVLSQQADEADTAFEESEYRTILLGRALGLLEPEFAPATWTAFRRTALDGLTPVEAAAELGISANSVYLARSRVLRRLRETLAGLMDQML
jgi:RNA polymerase sigma-70 factor (ECF subfamily)